MVGYFSKLLRKIFLFFSFFRWDDVYLINQLPEYMKLAYKTLLDVYSEIQNFQTEGRSYCIDYAKKGVSHVQVSFKTNNLYIHSNL